MPVTDGHFAISVASDGDGLMGDDTVTVSFPGRSRAAIQFTAADLQVKMDLNGVVEGSAMIGGRPVITTARVAAGGVTVEAAISPETGKFRSTPLPVADGRASWRTATPAVIFETTVEFDKPTPPPAPPIPVDVPPTPAAPISPAMPDENVAPSDLDLPVSQTVVDETAPIAGTSSSDPTAGVRTAVGPKIYHADRWFGTTAMEQSAPNKALGKPVEPMAPAMTGRIVTAPKTEKSETSLPLDSGPPLAALSAGTSSNGNLAIAGLGILVTAFLGWVVFHGRRRS